MKLALRFLLATLLGILVVVAASTALNFQRELNDYDEDSQRDHRVLAHALVPAFLTTWDREGQAAALRLLSRVNMTEGTLQSRWVPRGSAGAPDPALPHGPDGLVQVVQPSSDGGDMVTFAPVERAPAPGFIEIRESLAPRQRYVTESVVRAVLGGAGIFVWCAASSVLLGFLLVLQPVRALVAQARQIGAGHFTTRCTASRGDELGQLAGEMNHMAELLERNRLELAEETDGRLQALNQLRHADRLATAGKLGAGIAHELGTPLTVVLGRAKLIRSDASLREDTRRNAQIVEDQATRMTRIIRQLLDFTRARESKRAPTSASELVGRVVGLLTPIAEKQGTRMTFGTMREDARIDADSGQLEQVLTNLTMNALQALKSGGVVTFSVKAERVAPPEAAAHDDYVIIEVQDTGPGMPPQVAARVFEPFFTTKEVGEGTGLGLSVAYGIVQEHGGFLTVESKLGQGSRFCVHLPWGESWDREQKMPEWKRLKSA